MSCNHRRQDGLPCADKSCSQSPKGNALYTTVKPVWVNYSWYSKTADRVPKGAVWKQQKWVRIQTDLGWLWIQDGEPT